MATCNNNTSTTEGVQPGRAAGSVRISQESEFLQAIDDAYHNQPPFPENLLKRGPVSPESEKKRFKVGDEYAPNFPRKQLDNMRCGIRRFYNVLNKPREELRCKQIRIGYPQFIVADFGKVHVCWNKIQLHGPHFGVLAPNAFISGDRTGEIFIVDNCTTGQKFYHSTIISLLVQLFEQIDDKMFITHMVQLVPEKEKDRPNLMDMYRNPQQFKILSEDIFVFNGTGICDIADFLVMRYHVGIALSQSFLVRPQVLAGEFTEDSLFLKNHGLKVGFFSEILFKIIYGPCEGTKISELQCLYDPSTLTQSHFDILLATHVVKEENDRVEETKNHESQMYSENKRSRIVRKPRSQVRKAQEEADIDRQLPVIQQNSIERPPDKGSNDKYEKRVQYGPWFLKEPECTNKQLIRLKKLYPYLLTGEFDLKLMSKAFFQFNLFLFQQQYFKDFKNDPKLKKNAILAFGNVIEGRSLVRMEENLKPSFGVKHQTVYVWLNDYRMFMKVFCGTRDSQIADIWQEAKSSHTKTEKFFRPQHESQGLFGTQMADYIYKMMPNTPTLGGIVWSTVRASISDIPSMIKNAIVDAVKVSFENLAAALKTMRDVICNCVTTIKDFLTALFPPEVIAQSAKLALILTIMSVLILLMIVVPLRLEKTALCILGLALAGFAVALGFTVQEDFMEHLKEGEEEHESQSWDTVWKVIVMIGGMFSLRNISSFFSIGRNIKPVFSDMKEFFCKAWDWIYRSITGDHYWPEYDEISNLKQYMEDIRELFEQPGYSANYKVVRNYALKTVHLHSQMWAFKKTIGNLRLDNGTLKYYTDVMQNLENKATDVLASSAFFRSRYEPVCVILKGKPNQGKSKVSEFLPEAIYAHCRSKLVSEFPLEWSPGMVYSPSGEDFHDGLNVYSFCWKEDDFLQSRDRQIRAKQALNFIQLVSPAMYSLPSGKLEGKGNTFVTTPLIFMTSNFDVNDACKVAECNLEEPNAFRRRCHVVLEVERAKDFDDPVANANDAWRFNLTYHRSENPLKDGQINAQKTWPSNIQDIFENSTVDSIEMCFKEVAEMISDMIVKRAQQHRREVSTTYDWMAPIVPDKMLCPTDGRGADLWIRNGYVNFLKDGSTVNFLKVLKHATVVAGSLCNTKHGFAYFSNLVIFELTRHCKLGNDPAQQMFLTWWNLGSDPNNLPPNSPPFDDVTFNDPPNNKEDRMFMMDEFDGFKNSAIDAFYERQYKENKEKKDREEFDRKYGKVPMTKTREEFQKWVQLPEYEAQGFSEYVATHTAGKEGVDKIHHWIVGAYSYYFRADESIDNKGPNPIRAIQDNWLSLTPLEISDKLEKLSVRHHNSCVVNKGLFSPFFIERKQWYKNMIARIKGRFQGIEPSAQIDDEHPFAAFVNKIMKLNTVPAAIEYMMRHWRMNTASTGAEIPYFIAKTFQVLLTIPCSVQLVKDIMTHVPNSLIIVEEFRVQSDPASLVPRKIDLFLMALKAFTRTTTFYVLTSCFVLAASAVVAVLVWYFGTRDDKVYEAQSISREKLARLAERKPLKLQYKSKGGKTKTVKITKEQLEHDEEKFHQAQAGIGDQISNQINKFANNMRTIKFFRQYKDNYMEMETEVIFSGRRCFPVKHVFFAKGYTWDTIEIWNGETLCQRFDAKLVRIINTAEGRDLAYVDFPNDFQEFPSLKGKFIKPESIKDMDKYSFHRVSRSSVKGSPLVTVFETGHLAKGSVSTSRLMTPEGVEKRFMVNDFWISLGGRGIPGDCGKILIAADISTGQVYIMGIHIGRASDDTYYTTLSDADLLKEEAYHDAQNGNIIYRDGVHIPSYLQIENKYTQAFDGKIVAMGTVKSSFIPSETNFIKSQFQGNTEMPPMFPNTSAPARLKPFKIVDDDGVDSEVIKPLDKSLKKMTSSPVREFPRWLRRSFEKYQSIIFDGFCPRERKEFRMWTLEEALSKLDQSTSVGYDMQCLGFTSRTQLWTKEGDKVVWVHEKLRRLVMELWVALKAGKSVKNVISACLKDELRDLDRVNEGKTRLFCVGSLSHLILTVMVMGDIVFYMKAKRTQTDVCIGINPHGWEWTWLNRKLRRWVEKAFYGGGDYSNYDSSVT